MPVMHTQQTREASTLSLLRRFRVGHSFIFESSAPPYHTGAKEGQRL